MPFISPGTSWTYLNFSAIFIALILSLVNKIRYGNIGDIFAAIGKLIAVPALVLWFLGDMQGIAYIKMNFAPYYYYAMIVGAIMLVFLSNIGKKFDVLNSVLAIYFVITGLLGDVLSYIRLFALGASSGILGLVVNQIGGGFAAIPYVGMIIMVVFLIGGHAANFGISILGSLVHPLRLTFVEFYNNVGFKGGGKMYNPLKKTQN